MAGKLPAEGEWSSSITPTNPLENPPRRKSLLVSNPDLPKHSFNDSPTARSESPWSSLCSFTAQRGTPRLGKRWRLGQDQGTEPGLLQTQGAWLLAAAPSLAFHRNTRSLLQTHFLNWAQSQCYREL